MNGILARTSSGGTIAWYLTDKLGSVNNIVDTSGNVLDTIVYDSFGNIVTETDAANGDRFKFAGMQYDATTGQYYDHARYYGSMNGRFTGQDPTGFRAGDTNLYRYVQNGPTDFDDPTGENYASDYLHYLFNPGDQDTDIQTAQTIALTVAVTAGSGAAGGLVGQAAAGLIAAQGGGLVAAGAGGGLAGGIAGDVAAQLTYIGLGMQQNYNPIQTIIGGVRDVGRSRCREVDARPKVLRCRNACIDESGQNANRAAPCWTARLRALARPLNCLRHGSTPIRAASFAWNAQTQGEEAQ